MFAIQFSALEYHANDVKGRNFKLKTAAVVDAWADLVHLYLLSLLIFLFISIFLHCCYFVCFNFLASSSILVSLFLSQCVDAVIIIIIIVTNPEPFVVMLHKCNRVFI